MNYFTTMGLMEGKSVNFLLNGSWTTGKVVKIDRDYVDIDCRVGSPFVRFTKFNLPPLELELSK